VLAGTLPAMAVQVIGLDGDDTLWRNEEYFVDTQQAFRDLLAPYVNGDIDLDQRLDSTERGNLELFGYGVKGFTLSLIETAIEATEGRVAARDVQALLDLGKGMLLRPVELIEGVAETVPELAESYRLVVITKGDLWNQEQKLARSGLAELMWRVEIVAEKDLATYRRILRRHDIDPSTFVMVGNSVRSDVLPVIEAGGRAVHIPHEVTWAHEVAEHDGTVPTLRSIAELPEWLAKNG
jgi:putative hydrolase of the HAD superfamily